MGLPLLAAVVLACLPVAAGGGVDSGGKWSESYAAGQAVFRALSPHADACWRGEWGGDGHGGGVLALARSDAAVILLPTDRSFVAVSFPRPQCVRACGWPWGPTVPCMAQPKSKTIPQTTKPKPNPKPNPKP
jgi:hypothetical protein